MAMIEDDQPLDHMVLVPSTENIQLVAKDKKTDDLESTYSETWKGPWLEIKDAASGGTVFGISFTPGRPRPVLTGNTWEAPLGFPSTFVGGQWTVERVEVEQSQAGDHGLLKLSYRSAKEKKTDKERTEQRRWALTWQPYQFNVLNFISPQNRLAVLAWKKSPVTTNSSKAYYSDSRQSSYAELPDDQKVLKVSEYVQSGINPQYHTPMVTYHQEYELEEDEAIPFDISIDTIQQLENECPFKAKLTDWQFLLISDSVTERDTAVRVKNGVQIKTRIYSRERTWAGAKSIDQNFYGDQRWQPWSDDQGGNQ